MSFLFPPPPPAAIVIVDDGGGVIADYRRAAIKYNLEGREVRIAGSCRSACLLALSVKKVCVWPEAEVKDHLARKIGAQQCGRLFRPRYFIKLRLCAAPTRLSQLLIRMGCLLAIGLRGQTTNGICRPSCTIEIGKIK